MKNSLAKQHNLAFFGEIFFSYEKYVFLSGPFKKPWTMANLLKLAILLSQIQNAEFRLCRHLPFLLLAPLYEAKKWLKLLGCFSGSCESNIIKTIYCLRIERQFFSLCTGYENLVKIIGQRSLKPCPLRFWMPPTCIYLLK